MAELPAFDLELDEELVEQLQTGKHPRGGHGRQAVLILKIVLHESIQELYERTGIFPGTGDFLIVDEHGVYLLNSRFLIWPRQGKEHQLVLNFSWFDKGAT
jgi:hypothetical protein